MFPGFVTMYKDIEGFVHLYFFRGITDTNEKYYKDLDLHQCNIPYIRTVNDDESIDYKFDNKKIVKIGCKLIDMNNKEHISVLSIK